ncbi:MAG TPA: DUF222 domain-containing protein [Galbitalea sp.]|jgi:hypothetical protein|nr:DUF222 domain-containing protein [Galbitalea sp.]
MSNLAEQLLESASAVATLGTAPEDIAALDDASVLEGMKLITAHRRGLQAYEVLLSSEIAKRSSHQFGNAGLARSNGSATPAILIQSLTGGSIDEATKLARMGEVVAAAEHDANALMDAEAGFAEHDGAGPAHPGPAPTDPVPSDPVPTHPVFTYPVLTDGAQPPVSPLAAATVTGDISLAAADAIRKGLGKPDAAITMDRLRLAEATLLRDAGKISPEALLKLARVARSELDLEAVARGQKKRAQLRYVRTWQRDGMSGGSWSIPDEDGGADIYTALKLMLASRTGGPRFPQTDEAGNPIRKSAAQIQLEDTRTFEQVAADGFVQVFQNGLRVDPSIVPGAGRAPVRVIVTDKVLMERRGTASLEGSLSKITVEKLEEYLCEGGQVGVLFDENGNLIDVGREQRLFTKRQRTGLAVRDGGCRYPGCDKPPSWTEAHHILQWARDHGRTDIINAILLCRYHHMLIHELGAEIIQDRATYWLKLPKSMDPSQTLVEMPSKNPIIAAMAHASAS